LSFVALVSLFAFLGNSETYEIPPLSIPISALNFYIGYKGSVHNIVNYSVVPRKDEYLVDINKIGNHITLSIQAQENPINYTTIPFGYYLFRNDLKNLYSYPYEVDYSTPEEVTYRCENKGQATTESVLAKFADYVDLASSVRGKSIFTSRAPYSVLLPDLIKYTYNETKDITDDKYDKVNIFHEYVVSNVLYNLTISKTTRYYRHLKDGDFETSAYVEDTLGMNLYTSSYNLYEWEDFLVKNAEISAQTSYFASFMDNALIPNVGFYGREMSLVCPEIDHLPAPSLTELLPGNYTEYQLIFENPVCVDILMVSLADVLNLTSTHPERVTYSGIEKVDKEWAVDVIMPTDLGEILSTAVLNRDVKKSGYELVGKIVRMVSKKSGK